MIKKTEIKKNNLITNIIFSSNYESIEQYNNYIAHCISQNIFGLNERPEVDENGIETGVILPADYEIIETDVTQEIQFQNLVNKNLNRISFGQTIMAELSSKNQIKLLNNEISLSEIISLEEKLSKVQRYLMNGSTGLALYELQNNVEITELTEEEKTYFITKINNFLNSEA